MKKLTAIVFALVLIGAGCASSSSTTDTTEVAPVQVSKTQTKPVEQKTEPELSESQQEILKELTSGDSIKITMLAKQWEFTPATITVKQGQKVDMQIMSIDVAHGFSLPDFGVNERLEPGKMTTFSFIADKKGTFSFACSVLCGSGHGTMTGTLVVE